VLNSAAVVKQYDPDLLRDQSGYIEHFREEYAEADDFDLLKDLGRIALRPPSALNICIVLDGRIMNTMNQERALENHINK
jgi:hypothetical protein